MYTGCVYVAPVCCLRQPASRARRAGWSTRRRPTPAGGLRWSASRPEGCRTLTPPQGSRQPGAQSQPQDPITTRQTPDYTRLCRGLAGCLCGRRRVSIKYRLDPNLTLFRDDVGRPFGVYPSLTSACGNPLERLVWRTGPTSTAAPRGLSWQSRNYFRCCISTGLPVPRTTRIRVSAGISEAVGQLPAWDSWSKTRRGEAPLDAPVAGDWRGVTGTAGS